MKSNFYTRAILGSPILWGLLASVGFYALIRGGTLDFPMVQRYFAHHPVEYMETVMFMIGMAALVLKLIDVATQYVGLSQSPLGALPEGAWGIDQCPALLARLDKLSGRRQAEYYPGRLRTALAHVHVRGSAESLDNELKYLSDMDALRAHSRYGLFRLIVWAIPIMGFLGTVIGITMALNSMDLRSADQSMMQVLNGLGLKFDTTALALALSMVLMFVHFLTERLENNLLQRVDEQVEHDLAGRFLCAPAGGDGQLIAVRRMADTVIHAVERLVARQAELWQASMETAASRWTQMADSAAEQMHATLSKSLGESLKIHAQQLAAAEHTVTERNRQQWDKLLQSQLQSTQATAALQTALGRQAEVLERAVAAAGEVSRLEDALNRNLTTLAGAKHFEQTVMSLAAAIQLLSARLSDDSAATIKLESIPRQVHAA
jgi:hypothetical protein